MPNSYWCGRFQALSDRFHNEVLEASLKDHLLFKQFMQKSSVSPIPDVSTNKSIVAINIKGKLYKDETEDSFHNTTEKFLKEEDDRRSKRVFMHLEALCHTNDAKRSLWEWQLTFARIEKKEKLLPHGGRMTDTKDDWVSRVGRALIGNEPDSSLSRRSTGLGRRKVCYLPRDRVLFFCRGINSTQKILLDSCFSLCFSTLMKK
jgi:hypothetical protein